VSLLTLELLLDTSVEEEGDVGVLFGLCGFSLFISFCERLWTHQQCDTA
jgi:hypothetical protein